MKITAAPSHLGTTTKLTKSIGSFSKKIGYNILSHKKALFYTTLFLLVTAERFYSVGLLKQRLSQALSSSNEINGNSYFLSTLKAMGLFVAGMLCQFYALIGSSAMKNVLGEEITASDYFQKYFPSS